MVRDAQTGEYSESDQRFIADMEAELARARDLVKQLAAATKAAEDAAAQAESDAANARRVAGEKAGIASETVRTVSTLEDEMDAQAGFAERGRQGAAARRARDNRRRQDADARKGRDRDAAQAGEDAVAALPAGVRAEFREAVTKVARGLKDGDQGGELRELAGLMNRLAEAMDRRAAGNQSEIQSLRQRIANIEAREKNGRSPGK